MEGIVIFGCTPFSQMIASYIDREGIYKVLAYTVNEKYMPDNGKYSGRKVIPYEQIENIYPPERCKVVLAIGYQGMNELRKKIYHELKEKGYHFYTYIYPTASILTDKIGEGCIVFEGANIGYDCQIGNGNIIGMGVSIGHQSVVGDFNYFANGCVTGGLIKVGNNCMLGLHSVIRDKITVSDYTLIGSGTYIDKDTKEKEVYVSPRAKKMNVDSLDVSRIINI